MRHTIKWQVSLSNGKTFFEDKGDFCELDGQPSPWQRLLLYMAEFGAQITSLGLYADDGRVWNLPSGGNRPKFQAFETAEKPIGFNCFRKVAFDILPTGEQAEKHDLFTVGQAEFVNGYLEVWVDENNPKNTWTIYISKKSIKP